MRILILLVGMFSSTMSLSQDFQYNIRMCDALADPQQYVTGAAQRALKRVYQTPTHYLFSYREMFPPLTLTEEGVNGLKAFKKALSIRGTELLVMPVATRALTIPSYIPDDAGYDFRQQEVAYRRYVKQLRDLGVDVVDFSLMVGSGDPTLFYKRDFHWSVSGARVAADIVAQHVKQLSLYEGLQKAEFETKYAGVEAFNGAMPDVFEKICGERFPSEYRRIYQTDKIQAVNEDSLFSDVEREIVLVGTSFSALSTMNFPGYLSEALSVEVHDYSASGGGVYGALHEFLNSEDFQDSPPKLLIWEFPLYQTKHFNEGDIYAMLIPSVYGHRCNDHNKVIRTTRRLGKAGGQVLLNAGDDYQNLKQRDLLFDVEIDDPNVFRFTLDIQFVERRKQRLKIRKKPRLENDGRFVIDPAFDKELNDFHLMALNIKPNFSTVATPSKHEVTVTTTVCKK